MTRVHARFTGVRGTFATFGDSITFSPGFWYPLQEGARNMDPGAAAAYRLVKGYMNPACWQWKGAAYGNYPGQDVRWALANVDQWLRDLNPEAALIQFGTNDMFSVPLPAFERLLQDVVKKCLSNGTVVILSTIPPRHDTLAQARSYAGAIRRVAQALNVPLCDFQAECLRRRPDDWDGAAARFAAYSGYDVPTLISRDGTHPSYPPRYAGDYSAQGLRSNGYVLRTYVTLLSYSEVIRTVLLPAARAGRPAPRPPGRPLPRPPYPGGLRLPPAPPARPRR
jgi:hypothetical protein